MVSNRQTQMVEETAQLSKKWDWILALGVIYLALAIIAINIPGPFLWGPVLPGTVGAENNNALTLLLFASGGLRFFEAFSLRKNFDLGQRLFPPILSFIAGVILFRLELMQAGGLGVMLSFYFLATATAQLVSFTELMAVSPWRWVFGSAVSSLAIGIYILFEFPLLALFVPCTLVGIDLFVNGITMIGFSQSLKKLGAEFYSTKATMRDDSGRKEEYQREPQALRKRENSSTVRHDGH